MYRKPLDPATLWPGLTVEDYADELAVGVFHDNVEAVNLFISLSTQWRVGLGGPYGLDYTALYHKLDRMRLTDARYRELEEEILALEEGALKQMQEEAEAAAAKAKR